MYLSTEQGPIHTLDKSLLQPFHKCNPKRLTLREIKLKKNTFRGTVISETQEFYKQKNTITLYSYKYSVPF